MYHPEVDMKGYITWLTGVAVPLAAPLAARVILVAALTLLAVLGVLPEAAVRACLDALRPSGS